VSLLLVVVTSHQFVCVHVSDCHLVGVGGGLGEALCHLLGKALSLVLSPVAS
jgi:hypothetical protein